MVLLLRRFQMDISLNFTEEIAAKGLFFLDSDIPIVEEKSRHLIASPLTATCIRVPAYVCEIKKNSE